MLDVESPTDTNYTKLAADAVHELTRKVAGTSVSPFMVSNNPKRQRLLRDIRAAVKKAKGNVLLHVIVGTEHSVGTKTLIPSGDAKLNSFYYFILTFSNSEFKGLRGLGQETSKAEQQ